MNELPEALYIVVEATGARELGRKVSERIEEGYVPLGPLVFDSDKTGAIYIQTMIWKGPTA